MITPKPYGPFFKFLDVLFIPLMYLVSGSFEKPQETHRWNLQNIPSEYKNSLDKTKGVLLQGTYNGFLKKSFGGVLFHIPILGGWKEYYVLEADAIDVWYLGWYVEGMKQEIFQFSKLKLFDKKIRVLKPPADTTTFFFAFDAKGNQLPLSKIDDGKIGDGGSLSKIRLL